MRWTSLDRCLMAVVVLSAAFLGQNAVNANPEKCVKDSCITINDYLTDSAIGVTCFRREVADCHVCFNLSGNCADPGPTQPYCRENTAQQQRLASASNCSLACALAVNGYAEAVGMITPGEFFAAGNVWECKSE